MHSITVTDGPAPHTKLVDMRGEYTGTKEVLLPETQNETEFMRMADSIKRIIEHATDLKFSKGHMDTTHTGDIRIRFYGI